MKIITIRFFVAFLFVAAFQLHTTKLNAQSENKEAVYEFVDIQASYPGDYLTYLAENIEYPKKAIDANIQGTVYLDVTIGKTGKVEEVTIRKDPGGGLGKEAARVISEMPDWRPASQNGKAVNFKMTVPVKFVLEDGTKKKKKRRS